jgi:predicted Zn-dependent peptidase
MGKEQKVRKTRFENGLVVLSDQLSHVRSVSFGVFLREGSRHERAPQNGLSHFIEHSLFKGTRRRSAAQIAEEADALGGNLDAFTGREMVGFTNKVMDEHLPRAFELIADLVTAPAFDPDELQKERNVVLEEIKMVEDTPDDLVFEIFSEHFYPRHPLGRPILGTPQTLATFAPARVRRFYEQAYRPDNLVIAAAGNVEHRELLKLARKHFGHLPPRAVASPAPRPRPRAHVTLRRKTKLEQTHLVIGAPCPSLVSRDIYAAHIMCSILGGGMSSRLFQAVREDRGLVYTVFSTLNSYQDSGYLTVYAGASARQIRATVGATMREVRRLKDEAVSDEELQRNKDQLKTSLLLGLESSSSRMNALAQQEMIFGRHVTPDEIIRRVDAVSAADVRRTAREIFQPRKLALTVLGDVKGLKVGRDELEC